MTAVAIQTSMVLPDLWQGAVFYIGVAIVLGSLIAERVR